LLEVLVTALRADGGALMLMDPQTGLFWTGAVDRLPAPTCHPFFASELENEGARTFRRLARDRSGASALSMRGEVDDGFLTGVLVPFGYDDEVRVVCRDAGVAWGGLSLWRRAGAPRFCRDDERTLDDVAPVVGAALRDAVLRSLVGSTSAAEAHGVLVVEDGLVVDASPEARRLLREIDEPEIAEYRPLDHLLALSRRKARFSVVVGTSDGHWLTAHGTSLTGMRTVLVLTAPSPADLLGALIAGATIDTLRAELGTDAVFTTPADNRAEIARRFFGGADPSGYLELLLPGAQSAGRFERLAGLPSPTPRQHSSTPRRSAGERAGPSRRQGAAANRDALAGVGRQGPSAS
jgi:hypothetical protein